MQSVSLGIYEKKLLIRDLQDNDDPLAHYDPNQDLKEIRLLASDKEGLVEKTLPQDQSSIYNLFIPSQEENQEQEQNNRESPLVWVEEISEEHLAQFKDFLYIPDVIKTDKKVFFFGIPKFGAQFSARFQVNAYNSDKSFDDCLQKRIEFD